MIPRPLFLISAILTMTACQQPPDVTAVDQKPVNIETMTFFVTSVGIGDGADLRGLAGADAHCDSLAGTAGSRGKTWRAYLSTSGPSGEAARDRIGRGPWTNARQTVVATSLENLLSDGNALSKANSISESGAIINGRGDRPNRHDILTGTGMDGRLAKGDGDVTCGNWTSSDSGRAMLGHHDRVGGGQNPTHWSSAHLSRGCSQAALRRSGGDGLFYCFAID